MVDVATATGGFHEWQIFFLRFRQVQSVKMRIIKEVPLNAPCFVIHLVPFGARVDIHLELVELQRTFSRFRRRRSRRNKPCAWSLPVQDLFPVRGNCVAANPGEERFRLTRGQIKLSYSQLWRTSRRHYRERKS